MQVNTPQQERAHASKSATQSLELFCVSDQKYPESDLFCRSLRLLLIQNITTACCMSYIILSLNAALLRISSVYVCNWPIFFCKHELFIRYLSQFGELLRQGKQSLTVKFSSIVSLIYICICI